MTDVDYLAIDRQLMIQYHGGQMFLQGENKLDLFYTETLKDSVVNPVTGKQLTNWELEYIRFHDQCYEYTKDMKLSEELLSQFFNWYSQSRREGITIETLRDSPDTAEAYNIVRYYLTAVDFQSHFRFFDPKNSDQEAYERDLATKALQESGMAGKWLLRHSSRNRPEEYGEQEKLTLLGIRYYALSFIDQNLQIKHFLLTCEIGKGWISYDRVYTNFLDCLEDTLKRAGLVFYRQIAGYVQTFS